MEGSWTGRLGVAKFKHIVQGNQQKFPLTTFVHFPHVG